MLLCLKAIYISRCCFCQVTLKSVLLSELLESCARNKLKYWLSYFKYGWTYSLVVQETTLLRAKRIKILKKLQALLALLFNYWIFRATAGETQYILLSPMTLLALAPYSANTRILSAALSLLTGSRIVVILHAGSVTLGMTLATVFPVWMILKSLSNIMWNGNTLQKVAGLTFGSENWKMIPAKWARFVEGLLPRERVSISSISGGWALGGPEVSVIRNWTWSHSSLVLRIWTSTAVPWSLLATVWGMNAY